MAAEAILLRYAGRLDAGTIAAAILPGALIVGALRAALIGAAWPWIAAPLLLSWPAHLWDIRVRALKR